MLRTLYLSILFTHTVLAATVPVLAIITLRRAWLSRSDKHAQDRTLDSSDLAVRLCHGRGGLRHALPYCVKAGS